MFSVPRLYKSSEMPCASLPIQIIVFFEKSDAMNMSVVLGTLAGDDTVMVVMRDANSAAAFCGEIKSLMS